jgi:hypothetical protein
MTASAGTTQSKWVVQCCEWTTKPFATKAAAERALAIIEQAGDCRQKHEVREVPMGR